MLSLACWFFLVCLFLQQGEAVEGKGTHCAPQMLQKREALPFYRGRRAELCFPRAHHPRREERSPQEPRGAQRSGKERGGKERRAPLSSAPLRAGRPRPASLPFCSLAPEKANLLLRSDSAAAPCLRPGRAAVSRSSPRRSIGPAGLGAPARRCRHRRHRGPRVSQQRPARAAPLGRRQH